MLCLIHQLWRNGFSGSLKNTLRSDHNSTGGRRVKLYFQLISICASCLGASDSKPPLHCTCLIPAHIQWTCVYSPSRNLPEFDIKVEEVPTVDSRDWSCSQMDIWGEAGEPCPLFTKHHVQLTLWICQSLVDCFKHLKIFATDFFKYRRINNNSGCCFEIEFLSFTVCQRMWLFKKTFLIYWAARHFKTFLLNRPLRHLSESTKSMKQHIFKDMFLTTNSPLM